MKQILKEILNTYRRPNLASRDHFLRNLIYIYHTIAASERLLWSAAYCERRKHIADYFYKHLDEERNHHQWLSEDLEGIEVGNPPDSVMAMVGTIYYMNYHVNPVAQLGYMYLFESFPPPMETVEVLESLYGKKLCRTLRYHAEHDGKHSEEISAVLKTLSAKELNIVAETAMRAAHQWGKGLEDFIWPTLATNSSSS